MEKRHKVVASQEKIKVLFSEKPDIGLPSKGRRKQVSTKKGNDHDSTGKIFENRR